MNISGKIDQISSNGKGNSWININAGDGFASVWGNSYRNPTVLWVKENNWGVKVFDNEEYFQEWMSTGFKKEGSISIIIRIDENKFETVYGNE
jgi:hypothetical protein